MQAGVSQAPQWFVPEPPPVGVVALSELALKNSGAKNHRIDVAPRTPPLLAFLNLCSCPDWKG